jgi:hypothetical protein
MKDSEYKLSKSDCLKLLAEIEEAIEKTGQAMGYGDDKDVKFNDSFRRGKLQAYKYCLGRIESMMRWKGII